MKRPHCSSPLVATCLLIALAGAAPQGPSERQILRRQEAPAEEILQVERLIRLRLRLPVAPEVAFDAWTDAEQLVQWFAQWAEMTVDEGHGYRLGWDGVQGAWQGTYLEVVRPERLAFTWLPPKEVFPAGAYETRVTLTFTPDGDGRTLMTLEHTGFEGVAEMEAQLQAWRPYLFALRAYLLRPRQESP